MEKAINMDPRDEMHFEGNSERSKQRNALTVALNELSKQITRITFLIESRQC